MQSIKHGSEGGFGEEDYVTEMTLSRAKGNIQCFKCKNKKRKDGYSKETMIDSRETDSDIQQINEQSNMFSTLTITSLVSCSFCLTISSPKEKKKQVEVPQNTVCHHHP